MSILNMKSSIASLRLKNNDCIFYGNPVHVLLPTKGFLSHTKEEEGDKSSTIVSSAMNFSDIQNELGINSRISIKGAPTGNPNQPLSSTDTDLS